MTKDAKKARNRALAAALRNRGFTPNGQVWADAKKALAEGFTPKQAARLAASIQPKAAQEVAIARKAPVVTKAPVAQTSADEAFSRALEASVRAEAEAEAERAIPVQAQRVANGQVLRDARGRILSRAVQREIEEALSL